MTPKLTPAARAAYNERVAANMARMRASQHEWLVANVEGYTSDQRLITLICAGFYEVKLVRPLPLMQYKGKR